MKAATAHKKAPPITCATWCSSGDGHANEAGLPDQRCESHHEALSLTLHEQWLSTGGYGVRQIETWTQRGPLHPSAVVLFDLSEDFQVNLTPAEARALAARLIANAAALEKLVDT